MEGFEIKDLEIEKNIRIGLKNAPQYELNYKKIK